MLNALATYTSRISKATRGLNFLLSIPICGHLEDLAIGYGLNFLLSIPICGHLEALAIGAIRFTRKRDIAKNQISRFRFYQISYA